jgi:rubrerythrin
MSVTADNRLAGASVSEQEAFDALIAHERDEEDVIAAYEVFAKQAESDVVRFLIELIVEDERRHHRVLAKLANTIRAQATFEDTEPRLPYFDVHRERDKGVLDATRRFLAVERKDRAHLRDLAKTVEACGGEVDAFVVDLIRMDTERHIAILKFIQRLVRRSPIR